MVGIFLIIFWPFFLFKKYGNVNYRLEDKTVIVSNHYSTFDAFFIYLIYRKKNIRFVTIAEVKKRCASRFVAWLFDCLYIEDKGANLKFFKQCIDVLNSDGVICIFPEGVINPRKYGFFDFKNSFVYLAKKTGAKILPLYVYPDLRMFKYSSVYIGDVIAVEEYAHCKSLDEASVFVQCKIIEYSNVINT